MKPSGPKTEAGKARSCLNSVKHGLAGMHLLLPGEDAETYAARMDGVFVALCPTDEAEAQLVALIGDDLHKCHRLAAIEEGIIRARVEELLAQSAAGERAAVTAKAIVTVGTALTRWVAQPLPTSRTTEFNARLRAMSEAVELVADTIADMTDLVDRCREALPPLGGKAGDADVPVGVYARLDHAARALTAALLARGEREEAAQEELRKRIATIALPNEAELKKLQRYRKLVEEGLQRRLAALDQLRKLTTAQVTQEGAEKAREYRLRLRVVS